MLYQITQIADAFDPHAKILCNGSVYNLVWSRFSGFLRLLGDWNGLTALKLLHYYDGQTLSIYFGTIGTTQKYEETTANFVDSFPGDMFGFKKVKHFPDTSKLAQVVNIQRSNVIIPSSVKQCDNPDALKSYYLIRPFEPNASCDHMHLEQTLGFSAVPVALEITLRALDVSGYISELSQYQQMLKRVNSFSSQNGHFSGVRGQREWAGIERGHKVNDSVADDLRRDIAKLQLSLTRTNLQYSIKISSTVLPAAQYVSSVFAEECFKDGSYQLSVASADKQKNEEISESFGKLFDLVSVATVEELEPVFRPPIAGARKPAIIRCQTDPPDYPEEQMLEIGEDVLASTPNHRIVRGPLYATLKRHTAILGLNGCGKSVLAFSILLQAAQKSTPFLAIELGSKTDYRSILQGLRKHPDKKLRELGKQIRLLTPGAEHINPLRFNPLLVPDGVPVMLHAENVLSCFLATAVWPDPTPAILRKSVNELYHEFQFGGIKPSMKSLIELTHRRIDELPYSEKVKDDIHGIIETRLSVFTGNGAIAKMTQTESNHPSLDAIVNGFTIIEGAMANNDAFAFIVLTLLMSISEYFSVRPYDGNSNRLLTLIEELHNIVKPVPAGIQEHESVEAKASKIVINQLLEARSSGRPHVLIDQGPANIDDNVIRNCVSVMVGKQRDPHDVDLLAGSMLFGSADYAAVKKLGVGQFLLFTEGYHRPCLVKVKNLPEQLGLNDADVPFGPAILDSINDTDWYKSDLRCRVTEELTMLEKRLSTFETGFIKACQSAKSVFESNQKLTSTGMEKLKSKMYRSLNTFYRETMVPLANLDTPIELPADINELKTLILKRYEILQELLKNFNASIMKQKGM